MQQQDESMRELFLRTLTEHERTVNFRDGRRHCRCGKRWEAPRALYASSSDLTADDVPPAFLERVERLHREHRADEFQTLIERVGEDIPNAASAARVARLQAAARLRRLAEDLAGDPERLHARADEELTRCLAQLGAGNVTRAYQRVASSAAWWASA